MASLREIREGFLEEGVNSIFKGRTGQAQNGLLKQWDHSRWRAE